MRQTEIAQMVTENQRPDIPEKCENLEYMKRHPCLETLIKRCWDGDPRQRPSLDNILEILQRVIITDTKHLEPIYIFNEVRRIQQHNIDTVNHLQRVPPEVLTHILSFVGGRNTLRKTIVK